MTYDWTVYAPEGYDPESVFARFLDERVPEMSPKEWRIFRAAADLNQPDSLTFMAALTYSLHEFEFYYPAFDDASLGEQLAEFNYGVRSDLMPFLDMAEVGKWYRQEHDGEYIDGAYVTQCSPAALDRIRMKAESIMEFGLPADEDWSAKLHIAGPDGKEVWLRLPDWEEVNGGQADEVRIALDDLGVDTLLDCTLLEAKCILPQIKLMGQYDDLRDLACDASTLGCVLEDEAQGTPHFREKLAAAMEYEQCRHLDFALDIAANISCYDFVPDSDLKATGENLLPKKHLKQPAIMGALDYEGFAANHYLSQGMLRVEGGFFRRNDTPFYYMYSEEPSAQPGIQDTPVKNHREQVMAVLGPKLDRLWEEYRQRFAAQPPDLVFDCALAIATTRQVYEELTSNKYQASWLEYLLRFENPLEVVRDRLLDECRISPDEEMADALLTLMRTKDAERAYALDPAFLPAEGATPPDTNQKQHTVRQQLEQQLL